MPPGLSTLEKTRLTTGPVTQNVTDVDVTGDEPFQPVINRATPPRKNFRFANVGDSIGSGDSSLEGANPNKGGNGYVTFAEMMLKGRIRHVYNNATPGNTSASQLASFDATIGALSIPPGIVLIHVGANDANTSVSLATFQTNVQAIVAKVLALGALPVLATVTPRVSATPKTFVLSYNTWLRAYALANGYPLVDFFRILADPTTNEWRTGYSGDDIHPNATSFYLMATLLAAVLDPTVAGAPEWVLETSATNPRNRIKNPLFRGKPTPGGLAIDFAVGAASGTQTFSIIDDPQVPGGKKQRCAVVANANSLGGFLFNDYTTAPRVGDRCRLSGRIKVEGSITAQIGANGGSAYINVPGPCADLPFELDFTYASANLFFYCRQGTGAIEVSQLKLEVLEEYIVEDTVTRANSAVAIGTPDVAGVAPTVNGTWGVDSNAIYPVSAAAGDYAVWELGSTDQEVVWDIGAIPAGSQLSGPILCWVDANNYYKILIGTTGNLVGYRIVAGSIDAVIFNTGIQFAAGDQIRIRKYGRLWKALKFPAGASAPSGSSSVTETGTQLTGTKAGYRLETSGAAALRLAAMGMHVPNAI